MKKSDIHLHCRSEKEAVQQNLNIISKDSSKTQQNNLDTLTPLIPQKIIQKVPFKGLFQHQENNSAQHLVCTGAKKTG